MWVDLVIHPLSLVIREFAICLIEFIGIAWKTSLKNRCVHQEMGTYISQFYSGTLVGYLSYYEVNWDITNTLT